MNEGKLELHKDPMSDEWVKKIMDGLCKSIHTPRKVQNMQIAPRKSLSANSRPSNTRLIWRPVQCSLVCLMTYLEFAFT
jgi:hypothetical protein